jgi:hypothetical protein
MVRVVKIAGLHCRTFPTKVITARIQHYPEPEQDERHGNCHRFWWQPTSIRKQSRRLQIWKRVNIPPSWLRFQTSCWPKYSNWSHCTVLQTKKTAKPMGHWKPYWSKSQKHAAYIDENMIILIFVLQMENCHCKLQSWLVATSCGFEQRTCMTCGVKWRPKQVCYILWNNTTTRTLERTQ